MCAFESKEMVLIFECITFMAMQTIRVEALRERHLGVLQGLTPEEALESHPAAYGVLRSRNSDRVIPVSEILRAHTLRDLE